MVNFISYIISFVTNVIPTRNVIVFNSYPDFSDNAYALYSYMRKNGLCKKYRFVWLISDNAGYAYYKKYIKQIHSSTVVHKKKSVVGFCYFVLSRYVFYTHGCYSFIDLKQHSDKLINLWHGMPIKRIGKADNKTKEELSKSHKMIATNEFFREILAESFYLEKENVLLTGQPRNDLLFEETDFFSKKGVERSKYTTIGIWMPTFRRSKFGDIRIDGKFEGKKISFLHFSDFVSFNNFLKQQGVLLIIKLHPMDILQKEEFSQFSNILILKEDDMKGLQLYPLLGSVDFLITDYSSVWVDYDILNRPIGFAMEDVDEYNNSRGFNSSNMDFNFPGPIITDIEGLQQFIADPQKYSKERNAVYNLYKDNKSSERLITELKI